MPIHLYWNWRFEITPTNSIFLASNFQICMTVYLHINSNISNVVKYLWLLLSLCSLSYYFKLCACREGLQSRVWVILSSIYFGRKSFKASFWPKSFNHINSYPTMNPTHPPWLITKPSWFIHSTLCRQSSAPVLFLSLSFFAKYLVGGETVHLCHIFLVLASMGNVVILVWCVFISTIVFLSILWSKCRAFALHTKSIEVRYCRISPWPNLRQVYMFPSLHNL